MSYTVLARRYRSTTFDEVIGQEHVGQTLKKAIAADRVAHAYLFTGTRGVGKTSMARILAKALNCLSFDTPTATPCNTCDSCLRIAKGDDMDVIEIDAASNTGVDNVRDIIENAQYRPSRSRFKVYIIDEVHMLSKQAFNALLKIMEEPPGHVKFILATTEVEKVLPTILSRCQRYDFRNIPTREIAGHLKEIVQQEKIDADEDALLLVAKAGAGSMRDALSLLDRLLSVGEKRLTGDLIEQMLGLPKAQLIFDISQAIGTGDVKGALTRVTAMIQSGQSVDGLIAALIEHLRNLLILRTCGAETELVEVPGITLKELVAQAEQFDPAALVQDIAVLEELRRHVRQSQAGRALLDATLVRMTLSDQFASIGQLVARLDDAGGTSAPRAAAPTRSGPTRSVPSADSAQKKKTDDVVHQEAVTQSVAVAAVVEAMKLPAATPAVVPVSPSISAATVAPLTSSVPVPSASVLDSIDFGDDDLPRPGKVWDNEGPSLSELVKQSESAAAGVSTQAIPAESMPAAGSDDLQAAWAIALDSLKSSGASLLGIASQCTLHHVDDEGLAVIRIPAHCETFARQWERNGKRDLFRDAVAKGLGRSIGVKFEVDAASALAPTPTAAPGRGQAHRPSPAPRRDGPAALEKPAKPAPPPAAPPQRITQEQADAIRQQSPLIEALVQQLHGQIVKIE